jgi:hypothetical protein
MAVIINELEVVIEQTEPMGPAAAAAPPAPTAPVLNPLDLADVLERRARYHARLSAD